MFGCEQLDRGPGIGVVGNQLFLGESESHFTERGEQAVVFPYGHPALEIKDWDQMIRHLEELGIPYYDSPSKDRRGQNTRPDGSAATFVIDSEGNSIELTYHPAGRSWARSG